MRKCENHTKTGQFNITWTERRYLIAWGINATELSQQYTYLCRAQQLWFFKLVMLSPELLALAPAVISFVLFLRGSWLAMYYFCAEDVCLSVEIFSLMNTLVRELKITVILKIAAPDSQTIWIYTRLENTGLHFY